MAETPELKAAYEELDLVVRKLVALAWPPEEDDHPSTVTDWVVVVGQQFYDDDGDRVGAVGLFPREGSQPSYITEGLLSSALNNQQNRE